MRDRQAIPFDARGHGFMEKLPSYLWGSTVQSLACLEPPASFASSGGPAVLLVPGLFCTPSVMNRLGRVLEQLGADVYLPSAWPLGPAVMANTCRLEEAADRFLEDLGKLKRQGVDELTVVGHSNGGLIPLLALDMVGQEALGLPLIHGVVSMASPFGGSPIAPYLRLMVPACKDILPGASALKRIARQRSRVLRSLVSGFDSLVPVKSQFLDAHDAVLMEGFQHMDFIVGTRQQLRQTAALVSEVLPVRRPLAHVV